MTLLLNQNVCGEHSNETPNMRTQNKKLMYRKIFNPSWISGREEKVRRNYFMNILQESMGPGWDRTRDPWICNQTHYWLCYLAQHQSIIENYFSCFSAKTYVVGIPKNRLNEIVPRTVPVRRFFWSPKTNFKINGLENIHKFILNFLCLSQPMRHKHFCLVQEGPQQDKTCMILTFTHKFHIWKTLGFLHEIAIIVAVNGIYISIDWAST